MSGTPLFKRPMAVLPLSQKQIPTMETSLEIMEAKTSGLLNLIRTEAPNGKNASAVLNRKLLFPLSRLLTKDMHLQEIQILTTAISQVGTRIGFQISMKTIYGWCGAILRE